jgi:hypothetical protein
LPHRALARERIIAEVEIARLLRATISDLLCDVGDDHAAIGMATQHHVRQFPAADDTDDVLNAFDSGNVSRNSTSPIRPVRFSAVNIRMV